MPTSRYLLPRNSPPPPLPHPPIFAFHNLIVIVRIGSDKESGFYLQRGQISPSLSPSLRSEDRALEPTKVFTRRSFCYVGYVTEGKGGEGIGISRLMRSEVLRRCYVILSKSQEFANGRQSCNNSYRNSNFRVDENRGNLFFETKLIEMII